MKRTTLTRTVLALALTIPVATFAATKTTSTSAKQTAHPSHMVKPAQPAKVNVNTATRDQLLTLPGVDEAIAQKIVAARPFQSVDQLLKKNIVTKEEYTKIHSRLTAKPMSTGGVKK